jgi:hypothetical protein
MASALGYAYVLEGRVAEAMPLLEQAFARATAMRSMFDLSFAVGRLSEALACGMPSSAGESKPVLSSPAQ